MIDQFEDRMRSAGVWGALFISVCLILLILPFVVDIVRSIAFSWLAPIVMLLLYAGTLAMHLRGYAELGRKIDSALLTRSTQALMIALTLTVLSIAWSLLSYAWLSEDAYRYANALIGLLTVAGLVPALVFAIAIVKAYARFGFLTIFIAWIAPAAIVTLWYPWPVAILVGISSYFFWKIAPGKD